MHPDDLPESFFAPAHNQYCPMAQNEHSTLCMCDMLARAELDAVAEAKWDSEREGA